MRTSRALPAAAPRRDLQQAARAAAPPRPARRQLAGDAQVRKRVGPVGGDVHLQDVVGDPEAATTSSAPDGSEGDRIKIPSPFSPIPSSGSLHSMPGDITPADLARLQGLAPRQPRPGRRPRPPGCPAAARWPRRRPPLPRGVPARTRTRRSLSAPGCGRIAQHLGHQHAAQLAARAPRSPRPPGPPGSASAAARGGVQVRRRVSCGSSSLQPVQRDLHDAPSPAWNWRRNRKSFS